MPLNIRFWLQTTKILAVKKKKLNSSSRQWYHCYIALLLLTMEATRTVIWSQYAQFVVIWRTFPLSLRMYQINYLFLLSVCGLVLGASACLWCCLCWRFSRSKTGCRFKYNCLNSKLLKCVPSAAWVSHELT